MESMNFYEVKKRTEELAMMRKRVIKSTILTCLWLLLIIICVNVLYWGFLLWY